MEEQPVQIQMEQLLLQYKQIKIMVYIITYTGTGTNRTTIGHGLSSAPEFMVIKDRDGTNNWVVYSKDLTVRLHYMNKFKQ